MAAIAAGHNKAIRKGVAKGTYYIEVNTFTPQQKESIPQPQSAPKVEEDDLPF